MGELYKLDFPNGKSYIGITSVTTKERLCGHAKSVKHGSKIPVHCAWRVHGEPIVHVLAVVEDKELSQTEIRAIKVFNTISPFGYNISAGGELSPMHHPCAKAKCSAAALRAWTDPAYAENIKNKMKGNANRKGQPNSDEHNLKVSVALSGKPFTDSHIEGLRKGWLKRKAAGKGTPWNKGKVKS